eukprot:COSAG02_NODE_8014_length_2745_cov_7.637482_2_plen_67_part_00
MRCILGSLANAPLVDEIAASRETNGRLFTLAGPLGCRVALLVKVCIQIVVLVNMLLIPPACMGDWR